jgi:tetratricopeptide (TPR) repeat protein
VSPPPDPRRARTLDDLVEQLRLLKVWAGDPSYERIKDRIDVSWTTAGRPAGELPGKTTVVDCFRPGRRRLNTDLVVAVVRALCPDPRFVELWRQALRVIGSGPHAAAQVAVQDALPPALAEFTGRAVERDRLRGAVADGGVAVVEGMAGVGKTQFVIHVGHLLAEFRPFDQVLFVNLRGFDPGQAPADPFAVLDGFLRLLGVPGHRIPRTVEARTAAYRDRLAGTRALVVLDNAADGGQVGPLLPRTPGCPVLITSRCRLTGLGPATHLALDVFAPGEAADLLARVAPGLPVGADPDAPDRIARRCGNLPLAVAVVAGQLHDRPGWTFTDHADRLDERVRTRRLDDGVALAFDLSYLRLPDPLRRLLRLVALHPGQDFDGYAAAALAAADLAAAGDGLDLLNRDHLLGRNPSGRYVPHDLIRAYAIGRAEDEDTATERRAALTRLLDHFQSCAATAMDVLYPADRHHRPRTGPPPGPVPSMAGPGEARAWLDRERANLIAAAVHAARHDQPRHAIRLAGILSRSLADSSHHAESLTLHTCAREAARRTGDRAAEAYALTDLGNTHWWFGNYRRSATHYQRALTIFRETGDRRGEARALINLGAAQVELGNHWRAAVFLRHALVAFQARGDEYGQARVLCKLGYLHWRQGEAGAAAEDYREALSRYRRIGDHQGEALAMITIGTLHGEAGRDQQAAEFHKRALALCRAIAHRSGEAHTLTHMGDQELRLGSHQRASRHHREAVEIFRECGNRGGEAQALNGWGEALLAGRQPGPARERFRSALALAGDIGDRYEQARAHRGLVRCADNRAGVGQFSPTP